LYTLKFNTLAPTVHYQYLRRSVPVRSAKGLSSIDRIFSEKFKGFLEKIKTKTVEIRK
jgi:uncharacterized protein with von Willebrand factor type A (vWA) domain